MGNAGLSRRVESSLSLEGFTLKLEALATGRGLGKGVQDMNVVGLYLVLPPILRLQNFDPPALPSPTGQENSLSCGSAGRLSLVLGLVGKQGFSLKGEGEPDLAHVALSSKQGRFREMSADMTLQAATLCLHSLPGICVVGILA